MTIDVTIPVTGRTCGDCAMCCKIPLIPELDKPYNTWCRHCEENKRCGIYDTRPERCREFMCVFLLSTLGEEWRPNKCRMVVASRPDRVTVMVDPARPDAWRKEPYFSTMRQWSQKIPVYAMVGSITYAIFPDHVDDLGEVTDEHRIMTLQENTPQGVKRRAVRVHQSEVAEGQMPRLTAP